MGQLTQDEQSMIVRLNQQLGSRTAVAHRLGVSLGQLDALVIRGRGHTATINRVRGRLRRWPPLSR
jgi:hypothetical protein